MVIMVKYGYRMAPCPVSGPVDFGAFFSKQRIMFRCGRARCFANNYKDFSGTLGNVEYLKDLIPNVLQLIEKQSPPERSSCDGGLYVGGAGIGYAFYAVAERSAQFPAANKRQDCLRKALEYMKVRLSKTSFPHLHIKSIINLA